MNRVEALYHRFSMNQRQFMLCLVIALLAHIAFFGAVRTANISPPPAPAPVSLKIKLGSAATQQSDIQPSTAQAPTAAETVIPKDAASKPKEAAKPKLVKQAAKPKPKKAHKTPQASKQEKPAIKHQQTQTGQVAPSYLERPKPKPKPKAQAAGDLLGNAQESPIKRATRYTQKLSLWIDKFKHYPEDVKNSGLEGTAKIRLRIDRRGNIRYHLLTQRTPYPILDKLAMDAVRRANPVPPVPDSYPDPSPYLEFIIPLKFVLK